MDPEPVELEPEVSEPVELEPEEVPEEVPVTEEVTEEPQNEVDAAPEPEPEKKLEPDSYEARMAERRRRRADQSKEMEELETTKKEQPVQNGTEVVEDSYEARREARRRAREERRQKEAAAEGDKPRLTYRERKALEAKKQMDNARESRNKWSNMEEESGEK